VSSPNPVLQAGKDEAVKHVIPNAVHGALAEALAVFDTMIIPIISYGSGSGTGRCLGSVHISQVMWQNKTMKLNQEQYEKMLSEAAQTSENQESERAKRIAIPGGEWVQMEGLAQRIRGLACDLCPGKPLGQERCAASGFPAITTKGHYPNQSECGQPGLRLYQGPS